MANTKRQDILADIETTLSGVTGINTVEIDRVTPPDLAIQPLPYAFIFSDNEVRVDDGVIGQETWNWSVAIEVWAKDTDMEVLLGLIHEAMFVDYTRGNNADYSYRTAVEFFYVDPSQSIKGMIITYLIRYNHTQGDM